jgi:hypothetical protein
MDFPNVYGGRISLRLGGGDDDYDVRLPVGPHKERLHYTL